MKDGYTVVSWGETTEAGAPSFAYALTVDTAQGTYTALDIPLDYDPDAPAPDAKCTKFRQVKQVAYELPNNTPTGGDWKLAIKLYCTLNWDFCSCWTPNWHICQANTTKTIKDTKWYKIYFNRGNTPGSTSYETWYSADFQELLQWNSHETTDMFFGGYIYGYSTGQSFAYHSVGYATGDGQNQIEIYNVGFDNP